MLKAIQKCENTSEYPGVLFPDLASTRWLRLVAAIRWLRVLGGKHL